MRLLPLPSSGRLCVLAVSAGAAPGSTVLVGALDSWVVAREVGSGFHCCLMQASASRLFHPRGPFLHLQYWCCREDVFLHCFQLSFFLFNDVLVAGVVDFLQHEEDTGEQEGRSHFMRFPLCFLAL